MKAMRIPTDQGDYTVAVIDDFEITLDGQVFRFAVNTSPVVGLASKASPFLLSLSEYATGYRLGTLPHGNPAKYRREQALAIINEKRNAVGEAGMAATLRTGIASKSTLNTGAPPAQVGAV